MKQRVITSCVALVVLFLVLALFETMVFNVAVALVVAVAVYELLHAAGCTKYRLLTVAACLYAASIPLIHHSHTLRVFPLVTLAYIALLLLLMLAHHQTLLATQIGFVFFVSVVVAFSLTVAIYFRDKEGPVAGLYLIMLALAGAWMSDTGAYFVGCKFGRHKLAPRISPKKTVEGALGGILFCFLFYLLFSLGYQWFCKSYLGLDTAINYLAVLLGAPAVSVAGMLGDLSASVIKRQNNIKDFGNIMPGHGGMVDRFDSVFFTAPAVFILSQYVTLFTVL